MQAELNAAVSARNDLERQLNAATEAKQRYKTQWARALREVAKLQQEQRSTEGERLRREQKELAHMRLQYLVREERELTGAEGGALASIREELNKLREASTARVPGVGMTAPVPPGVGVGGRTQATAATGELRRLNEERSALLETGMYSHDDQIVQELDRRIQGLLAAAR
jgi:hypothetical protein